MATQLRVTGLPQIALQRGIVPIVIIAVLVVWLLYSAVLAVPAASVGVIQGFGHFHDEDTTLTVPPRQ